MGITASNTLSSLVSPQVLEVAPQGLAAMPATPEDFSAVLNSQLASLANAAAGVQAMQTSQTQLNVLANTGAPGLTPMRPIALTAALTNAPSDTMPRVLSELIKPTASQEAAVEITLPPAQAEAFTTKDVGTPEPAITTTEAAKPTAIAALELAALATQSGLSVSDPLAVNRKIAPKSESTESALDETPRDHASPPSLEALIPATQWTIPNSPGPRLEPPEQKPAGETSAFSEGASTSLQNLAAAPPPATNAIVAGRSGGAGRSPAPAAISTVSSQALPAPVQQSLFSAPLSTKPLATGAPAAISDSSFATALKDLGLQQNTLSEPLSSKASAPASDPAGSLARLALGNAASTPLPEPANVAAKADFGDILPGTMNPAISLPTPNQAAAPPTPAPITVPVQTPQWGQELGDRVVWMAKHDLQTAQINITPAQLGPIQISISLNGDQATAMFASPYPEVRQAIQDSLHNLRETFAAAGINLGQSNVGAQLPQQQQEAARQFANANRSSGETDILRPDTQASTPRAGLPIQRGRGLVDLFA